MSSLSAEIDDYQRAVSSLDDGAHYPGHERPSRGGDRRDHELVPSPADVRERRRR